MTKILLCINFRCGFHWIIGKWEHCSATCGENGISHRQLYCVPSSIDNTMFVI